MKYDVCAKYCGTVISLACFPTRKEAETFAQYPFVLYNADEMLDAEEDEVIYPEEMWVEASDENQAEVADDSFELCYADGDELPF